MICGELREFYELYAMDALEMDSQVALHEHLNRNCPVCTAGVKRAVVSTSLLATLPLPGIPPRRLKRRVLVSIGRASAEYRWFVPAALALCAVLAVFIGMRSQRQSREIAILREEASMLRLPNTRQVEFPGGRVLVNHQSGVLLILPNLAPAGKGHSYEMWLIPKGKPPVPAGLFQSSAGTTVYLRTGPVDDTTSAIAVSLEPASGSTAPTTKPIFVAAL